MDYQISGTGAANDNVAWGKYFWELNGERIDYYKIKHLFQVLRIHIPLNQIKKCEAADPGSLYQMKILGDALKNCIIWLY